MPEIDFWFTIGQHLHVDQCRTYRQGGKRCRRNGELAANSQCG